MINSYPSVFNIGHKAIANIFEGDVLVEEKVDGSQISFGVIDGELQCRSKGKNIVIDEPEGMFKLAIETIKSIENKLHPGWVYRCEYLQKPKHNVIAYSRVPKGHLVLFDVQIGQEDYLEWFDKYYHANMMGIDCVPALIYGHLTFAELLPFLDKESFLGGARIEGFVVKNYSLFTDEKKIAIGKYVSEKFKEVAQGEWKKENPTSRDVIAQIIMEYRTEARWGKAIQHLRDSGELENSPRDIGMLIREIPADVLKECEDEIKHKLLAYAWPHIKRGIIRGFPEWYKQRLAEQSVVEKGC